MRERVAIKGDKRKGQQQHVMGSDVCVCVNNEINKSC